jgi:transcriptional regulator with XRE-family HTH domain
MTGRMKGQARLRLAKSDDIDLCKSYSFSAASPRGTDVRPCSISLTDDGARPTREPISASVIPFARSSEMRDAHVVMDHSRRDPVEFMQRHPVEAFGDAWAMPRPPDLPSFELLGKRIAYWREKRGWSRSELARRAKIPYSTLSGIEDGDQMTSTKVPQIAAALGVDANYLATDRGSPNPRSAADTEDSWPFPIPREEIMDLDPIELELVGLKLQRIIEEIRSKRTRHKPRKTG